MKHTRHIFDGARAGQKIAANVYQSTAPDATGRGITLLLTHANGFHKELWEPVLEQIFSAQATRSWHVTRAIAMDWWNQGDSAALNPDMPGGPLHARWFDYARDILAVVRQLGVRKNLIGIGHSWGAANLQLAEIMSPLTFAGLFLVEPATPTEITPEQSESLAAVVRKRRFQWKSMEDAHAHFENHSFAESWNKRMLGLFIQHGLTHGDGQSMLKCLPGPEADGFAATAYGAPFIGRNLWRIQCPCVYLTGSESDKVTTEFIRDLIAPMPDCEHFVAQGRGHLLLHEDPDLTAAHCIKSLDKFAMKLGSIPKL